MTDNPNLAEIRTVEVDGPNGAMIAIMANFNFDPPLSDTMVRRAVDTILSQRMCSPPETKALLVTIVGEVTLDKFLRKWHDAVAADPAMSAFMAMMVVADVVRGTESGERLESESRVLDANWRIPKKAPELPIGRFLESRSLGGKRVIWFVLLSN